MAIIPKEESPFVVKGITLSNAYRVIDELAKADKINKTITYYVDTYADRTQRGDQQNMICKRIAETCSGDDYDAYFGVNVLNQEGTNPIAQAYKHLMQIKDPENAEELKYKGWIADE